MAFNADRKFDRVRELVNKIGRTTEEYQNRLDAVEGSKISYDASVDPEYLRGKKERDEAADLQVDLIRGDDSERTRGYDNSWNNTEIKQYRDAQAEGEYEIRKQMREQKINAFNAQKEWRLQQIKNRFAQVQYQNFYDLNKASEDYNFTVDRNYRKQQERLQRKNA